MSFSYTSSPARRSLYLALSALALTLLIRFFAGPALIEQWYSRGLFQGFRSLWGFLTSWFPIPLFYFFCIFGLTQVQALIRKAIKAPGSVGVRMLTAGRKILTGISWLIVAFMWMWGFNYGRPSVTATLKFPESGTANPTALLYQEGQVAFSPYALTLEELRDRVYTEAAELAALRGQITTDTLALSADHYPVTTAGWTDAIQPLIIRALQIHGYPTNGPVRARQLWPPGLLLRWSTAGVYWPWVGEGHIDRGLHHLQKPSVLAHELAHAYGFGDEGTCSFWAHLAGRETQNPALSYAFRLDYWRRIASRLRRADPEGYLAFRTERLDRGIINDLRAIYANNDKYPDLLPAVRDATYNTYLKAQGIEEGMLSYGKVVQLVEGYVREVSSR